jgi:hypothetical protein
MDCHSYIAVELGLVSVNSFCFLLCACVDGCFNQDMCLKSHSLFSIYVFIHEPCSYSFILLVHAKPIAIADAAVLRR